MRPTSFEQDVNPFYSVCRAKARPNKKARTTNPLEGPVAEEEEPRGEPEQLVDRKALILKLLLITRPLKAKILMSQQTLILPHLMLNRQNQTGLVQ